MMCREYVALALDEALMEAAVIFQWEIVYGASDCQPKEHVFTARQDFEAIRDLLLAWHIDNKRTVKFGSG